MSTAVSKDVHAVGCYCCDVMQLVQDQLAEAVRAARRGEYIAQRLEQTLVMVRQTNQLCNKLHDPKKRARTLRQMRDWSEPRLFAV